MKYPRPGEEPKEKNVPVPEPWEQQPGEPLEHFRWLQIYLARPLPRNLAGVSQTLGLPPAGRLVARACSRWNWEDRAAACDKHGPAFSALQRDWRALLLNELAYIARFTSLQDTGRALAGAAAANQDRAELRKHLGPLLRRQRGLLNLVPPIQEAQEPDFDEKKLHGEIFNRSREIYAEWTDPLIMALYREDPYDPAKETEAEYFQRHDALVEEIEKENQQDHRLPREILPWERQPAEPAAHFYLFRIYLSLMFLQSTRQVARMARAGRETTLARIARKWTWKERAAAFEASLADQPLARFELQRQLLLDKAYELRLDGLLHTNRALEKAEIGRLDRATASQLLPLLSGHQRSLLQQISRIDAAAERNSLDQRRDVRLAALIEEKALQMATDSLYEAVRITETLYSDAQMDKYEKDPDFPRFPRRPKKTDQPGPPHSESESRPAAPAYPSSRNGSA